MILSVITARAGSSLKGKNYRIINGKPLFEWSMIAAAQCEKIDLTMVSTNCPVVEEGAVKFILDNNLRQKMTVIKRPEELCTATSKNEEALIHAVELCQKNEKVMPDWVINLQPTSPIRRKTLIKEIIDKTILEEKTSAMTVQQFSPLFVKNNNGNIEWLFDRLNRKMRQQFSESEMLLHDDGCIYLTKTEILLRDKCRLGENPCIVINDRYSSFQIDTEEDIVIISNIMKEIQKTGMYV